MDLDIPLPEECPAPPGETEDLDEMDSNTSVDNDSWTYRDDEAADSNDIPISNENSIDTEDGMLVKDNSLMSFDDSRYSPSKMSDDSDCSIPFSPLNDSCSASDVNMSPMSEIGLPPIDTSGALRPPPPPRRKLPQIPNAILRKTNPKPKPPAKILKGSSTVLGKEQAKRRLLAFSASKQSAIAVDKCQFLDANKSKGSGEESETVDIKYEQAADVKTDFKPDVKSDSKLDSKSNSIKVSLKDSDNMRNIAEIMQEELKMKAQLEKQRAEREARHEALRADMYRGGRYDRYRDDWDRGFGRPYGRNDRRYYGGGRKKYYKEEEYFYKKNRENFHDGKVHRITEIPNSWGEFKAKSVQYEDIRRIKRMIDSKPQEESKRNWKDHRNEYKESETGDGSESKEGEDILNPFIAKGIWGRDKEFPRYLVKFTKLKPHISYCANPLRAAGYYKSRKDLLAICEPEIRMLMEDLINKCSNTDTEFQDKVNSNKQSLVDDAVGLLALQSSYVVEGETSENEDEVKNGFWFVKSPSEFLKETVNGELINSVIGSDLEVIASKNSNNVKLKSKWDSDDDSDMSLIMKKKQSHGFSDEKENKSCVGDNSDVRSESAKVKLGSLYGDSDGMGSELENNDSVNSKSKDNGFDSGLYDDLDNVFNTKKSEDLHNEYEEFMRAVSQNTFSKDSVDQESNTNEDAKLISEETEKIFKMCNPLKLVSNPLLAGKEVSDESSSSVNEEKSSTDESSDSSGSSSSDQSQKKKKISKKQKKTSKKAKKKLKRKHETDSEDEEPKKKIKQDESSKSSDTSGDEEETKKSTKKLKKAKKAKKGDSDSGDSSKKRKKKKKAHDKKKKHSSKLKSKKKKKKKQKSSKLKKQSKSTDDENEDENKGGASTSNNGNASSRTKSLQDRSGRKGKGSQGSKSESPSMAGSSISKFTLLFNLDDQEEAIKKIIANTDENYESANQTAHEKDQLNKDVTFSEALYSPEDLLDTTTNQESDAYKALLSNLNESPVGEMFVEELKEIPAKPGIPVVLPPDEPFIRPPTKVVIPAPSDKKKKKSFLYSDDYGFSGVAPVEVKEKEKDEEGDGIKEEEPPPPILVPGTESPVSLEVMKVYWEGGANALSSLNRDGVDADSEAGKEPVSRIIHGPNPNDVIDMNEVMKELQRRATMLGLTKFQGFSSKPGSSSTDDNPPGTTEKSEITISSTGFIIKTKDTADKTDSLSQEEVKSSKDSEKLSKDSDKDRKSHKDPASEDVKRSRKHSASSSRSDDESDERHSRRRRDRDGDRNYRSDKRSKYKSSRYSDSYRSRRSPSPRYYDRYRSPSPSKKYGYDRYRGYDRYSSGGRYRSDKRPRYQSSRKKFSRQSRSRSSSPKSHRPRSPVSIKKEDSKVCHELDKKNVLVKDDSVSSKEVADKMGKDAVILTSGKCDNKENIMALTNEHAKSVPISDIIPEVKPGPLFSDIQPSVIEKCVTGELSTVKLPENPITSVDNNCDETKTVSPVRSPKRLSLDDRIEIELGISLADSLSGNDVKVSGVPNKNMLEVKEPAVHEEKVSLYEQFVVCDVTKPPPIVSSIPLSSPYVPIGNLSQQNAFNCNADSYKWNEGFSEVSPAVPQQVVRVGNLLQVIPTAESNVPDLKPLAANSSQPVLAAVLPSATIDSARSSGFSYALGSINPAETTTPIISTRVPTMPTIQQLLLNAKTSAERMKIFQKSVELKRTAAKKESLSQEGIGGKPVKTESLPSDSSKKENSSTSIKKKKKKRKLKKKKTLLKPVIVSLPPAGKGILILPGDKALTVLTEDKRKNVMFADGIKPGDGTSPENREDLPSPPPPSFLGSSVGHKERRKKTKIIKIKRVRRIPSDESDDDNDSLPPPSPPPGSPPDYLLNGVYMDNTLFNACPINYYPSKPLMLSS